MLVEILTSSLIFVCKLLSVTGLSILHRFGHKHDAYGYLSGLNSYSGTVSQISSYNVPLVEKLFHNLSHQYS